MAPSSAAASSKPKPKVPSKQRRFALTIAVLIQNEALWLPEWLEYHLLPSVGVDHIYLYDDASTDQLNAAVEPYVARGQATLLREFTKNNVRPDDFKRAVPLQECKQRHVVNSKLEHSMFSLERGICYHVFMLPPQKACVRHAVQNYGALTAWMGFFDVDEYLVVTPAFANIPALLTVKHEHNHAVRVYADIMLQSATPKEVRPFRARTPCSCCVR